MISENRKQQFDFHPHGTTFCRFAPYYSLRSGSWSAFLWNGKWPGFFFSRMLWMLCSISLTCLCLHPKVHRPSFLGTVLYSAWVSKPFKEKTQHSQIPREWDRQAMWWDEGKHLVNRRHTDFSTKGVQTTITFCSYDAVCHIHFPAKSLENSPPPILLLACELLKLLAR